MSHSYVLPRPSGTREGVRRHRFGCAAVPTTTKRTTMCDTSPPMGTTRALPLPVRRDIVTIDALRRERPVDPDLVPLAKSVANKGQDLLRAASAEALNSGIPWRSPLIDVNPRGYLVLDWRSGDPWLAIIVSDEGHWNYRCVRSRAGDEPTLDTVTREEAIAAILSFLRSQGVGPCVTTPHRA